MFKFKAAKPKIFISYRREDTRYIAKSIYNQLRTHFGKKSIFFDTDIPAGTDFRKWLNEEVQQCQVLIAIIGPNWLGPRDNGDSYRIHDPSDWVRFEIESALARDILVIPLLVEMATLPKKSELPESLQDLVFRNTATLRHGNDFDTDLERLITGIEQYFSSRPIRSENKLTLGKRQQKLIAASLAAVVGLGSIAAVTKLPRDFWQTLTSQKDLNADEEQEPTPYSDRETINKLISVGDNPNFEGMPRLSTTYPRQDDYAPNYEGELLTYAELKEKGIQEFAAERYEQAAQLFDNVRTIATEQRIRAAADSEEFQAATEALQDPEVLIFKNNSEVRRRSQAGEQIYTIAAAVPLTDAEGAPFNVGKEMLQGIAQAQDKAVNSNLPDSNVEVVIANDRNLPKQASAVATALTQSSSQSILAVIGHYLSKGTCEALVQAYNNAPLVVVSPLSTASDMRKNCGGSNLFFRTTSSTTIEAKTLVEHLQQQTQGQSEVKVAIFHREGEFYSEDLFRELQAQLNNIATEDTSISIENRIFNLADEKFDAARILDSIGEVDAFIVLPDGRNATSKPFSNALEVIKANNGEKPVLGSVPLYHPDTIDLGGGLENLQNTLFLATDWHEDCAPEDFPGETDKYWGGTLNRVSMLSYEAFQSLVPTLSENVTPIQIRDRLNDDSSVVSSDIFKDKSISFLSTSEGSGSTEGSLKPGDRREIESRVLVTVGDIEKSPFIVVDNSVNRANGCI